MGKRSLILFLEDILKMIEAVERFTLNIDFKDFDESEEKQAAVVKKLENIGEAVKQIPDELRAQYPLIPWANIAGMRDILVHEYWDIDLDIIWQVIQKELPALKLVIVEMLISIKKSENSD